MKKKMMKLVFELMKDSKRSDRELAKVLNVSQPTVSRRRSSLVKKGMIKEFTVIPDFVELGYEILAISCINAKTAILTESEGKAEKYWEKYPNVIFVSSVHGMGKNGVIISLHKNYTDYSNFRSKNLLEFGDTMEEHDSLLIDLKGEIVKPLSLKYLAEQKET